MAPAYLTQCIGDLGRREFLRWTGAGIGATALTGCQAILPLEGTGAGAEYPAHSEPGFATVSGLGRGPIVDAHCHVFNAIDIPMFAFVRDAFLNADETLGNRLALPFVCSFADVLQGAAFTAREEQERLAAMGARRRGKDKIKKDEVEILAAALLNASISGDLLDCVPDRPVFVPEQLEQAKGGAFVAYLDMESQSFAERRRDRFRHLVGRLKTRDMLMRQARDIYEGDGVLSISVRWALRYTRYRFEIVQDLLDYYPREGQGIDILTPALVDFAYWVDDFTTTPLPDQIRVMAEVAKACPGQVRPLVAFDPWRQAIGEATRRLEVCRNADDLDNATALAMARYAVKEMGFVGTKVYPPMGFRPIGNADIGLWPCPVDVTREARRDRAISPVECDRPAFQTAPWRRFPPIVRRSARAVFGIENDPNHLETDRLIGRELDASLTEFYRWSIADDVPIMTHCRDSQEVGTAYGQRAHPKYWKAVLRKPEFKNLRLNLGHFGDMFAMAEGLPRAHERSWAWDVAELCNEYLNVYTDVGFFGPLLAPRAEPLSPPIDRFLDQLIAMAAVYRNLPKKVMYGSDYSMIGGSPRFAAYLDRFAVIYDARFSATDTAEFLGGNANTFFKLGWVGGATTSCRDLRRKLAGDDSGEDD